MMAKKLAPNLFTCESSGWARMSRGENCLPPCSPTTFVLRSNVAHIGNLKSLHQAMFKQVSPMEGKA